MNYTRPCDHCGGVIEMHRQDGQLMYTCAGCGCQWRAGLVIVRKGEDCPVHGTTAVRTLAQMTGSDAALYAYGLAELGRMVPDDDDAEPPF